MYGIVVVNDIFQDFLSVSLVRSVIVSKYPGLAKADDVLEGTKVRLDTFVVGNLTREEELLLRPSESPYRRLSNCPIGFREDCNNRDWTA